MIGPNGETESEKSVLAAEHDTGWNDKIFTLEKTTWFHFRLMKTGFLFFFFFFFCCRPSTSWPVLYKSQERYELSIMSESDTMFNERDRWCTAVQLKLSTDPSSDNRTIASTLKMQIRTVQRLRAHLNVSDDPLEVVERKDTARKTRTKEFIEKVQAIIDETPQRPIWQIIRNLCVKEDLKCSSYRCKTGQILTEKTKNLWLIKSVGLLPPPTWTRWTTSFGHPSRTSPTWPPTTPKPARSPPFAEYSLGSRPRLWKRHAPSSGSVSKLKAAKLNRYQLYYIIKLPELIFSIKVLK